MGRAYERARDGCLRAVYAAVGDRSLAEDLTAEAFTKALANWRKVGRYASPRAWIVHVALNTHVSWWRRRRREVAWDDGRPEPADPRSDTVGATRLLDEQIVRAVRALSRRQREVVALRIFLDLDTETTARTLGVAPGTVTAHLSRAIATLRGSLASTRQENVTR